MHPVAIGPCRYGEILRLRWDAVRRDRLDLTTTKRTPNDESHAVARSKSRRLSSEIPPLGQKFRSNLTKSGSINTLALGGVLIALMAA